MRQEIISPATGNIVRNIRAYIRIFRQAYCSILCGIRPHAAYWFIDKGTLLSRLDA